MSATRYYAHIAGLLDRLHSTQLARLERAGELAATTIAGGGRVYLFGSGHSVIPVMDVFPRYGSFVGFYPLYDPRLMWSNVIGPNGARELLWIERREGYVEQFLQSYPMGEQDCLIVFSHGGLNAAPIEAALYARKRGVKVISVSSLENARTASRSHSSGKALSDLADVAIDNGVAPENAQWTSAGPGRLRRRPPWPPCSSPWPSSPKRGRGSRPGDTRSTRSCLRTWRVSPRITTSASSMSTPDDGSSGRPTRPPDER